MFGNLKATLKTFGLQMCVQLSCLLVIRDVYGNLSTWTLLSLVVKTH